MGDPVDILARVQADVGAHAREEDVRRRSQAEYGDRLALQVADRADAVGPEQLEAADVDAGQDRRSGSPASMRDDERSRQSSW